MEKIEVMAAIAANFIKGAASTIVVNKSADSSMNKGRGNNRNPFYGRVMVRKTYHGYVMGTDYRNSIEAIAKRMGNDDADAHLKEAWHQPTAHFGEWFSTYRGTPIEMETDGTAEIFLKVQRNAKQVGCKTEVSYYVDGREATEEEKVEISKWLKKKSNTISSTQTDLGVDAEHQQHYLLMRLNTITLIKQNEREISPSECLTAAYAVAYANA